MKKFVKNKLYKIRFYDHSIGTSEKIVCEVVGWVIDDDKDRVLLSYWIVDSKCEETKKGNMEPVSIIKSCILKAKKLEK